MNNYSSINTIIDEHTASHLADLFRTLSDPTRVRIISALLEGELSVGSLSEAVDMSESAVSHQLRDLRLQRVVKSRKLGRQVFYSLADEHVTDLFRKGLEHMHHDD